MVHTSGEDLETISQLITEGRVIVKISEVLPADQIADAHRQLESRRTTGKIVLTF
jgi:NADPH:quinone reductase-like Zn-dependent oxidoreductase